MHRTLPPFIMALLGLTLSASLAPSASAQEVGLDDGEHLPLTLLQVGLDGNYSSGNFEQRRVSGRASLFKRWGETAAALSRTSYQYMRNGDFIFADNFRSMLVLTHRPLDPFQFYAIGLYHDSYTRFIDQRFMGGLGVAYSPLRSKLNQLKIGLSGAREMTTWESRPPPFSPPPMTVDSGCLYRGEASRRSCTREMWRFIPRLVGRHILADKHLILDYEALWVVDPFRLEDERVYASVTASAPILSWLSLYTHYDISFESIILDHREQRPVPEAVAHPLVRGKRRPHAGQHHRQRSVPVIREVRAQGRRHVAHPSLQLQGLKSRQRRRQEGIAGKGRRGIE